MGWGSADDREGAAIKKNLRMKGLQRWKCGRTCGLFCLVFFVGMAGPAWNQTPLPEGEGKEIVEVTCTACHVLNYITDSRNSKEGWHSIVMEMISYGAVLDDKEITVVVEYLAEHFGPAKAAESSSTGKINVNKATARERVAALWLTEREGEAVVQYHQRNGNFTRWEDLEKVSGLDSKEIEAKREQLEF